MLQRYHEHADAIAFQPGGSLLAAQRLAEHHAVSILQRVSVLWQAGALR